MQILIADDDPISRLLLQENLEAWGYKVTACVDGDEAFAALTAPGAPLLAILDWMMPGINGTDVCRRLAAESTPSTARHLILLTARTGREAVVEGLRSGAADYVTKPFDRDELQARVAIGKRIIELQTALAGRVAALEAAALQIKQLHGLLPICSYCKKIRDDNDYWNRVESYVEERSGVRFSHGICPDCYKQVESEFDMPSDGPSPENS
jgi:CheY-like chemotaxis protein